MRYYLLAIFAFLASRVTGSPSQFSLAIPQAVPFYNPTHGGGSMLDNGISSSCFRAPH